MKEKVKKKISKQAIRDLTDLLFDNPHDASLKILLLFCKQLLYIYHSNYVKHQPTDLKQIVPHLSEPD